MVLNDGRGALCEERVCLRTEGLLGDYRCV